MNFKNSDESFLFYTTSIEFNVEYDVNTALKQEGLKKEDYSEICRRLKRAPNRTELGMFGVMWSEHCCYRNSRPLLNKFPTEGPQILVGPGENAGVVDLGQGQHLAFKIESHNHPSAVEPFQGAATGVGGILRDIFTMGARPIALLNALRFGPLENETNIALMEGVVSGIAHYGNCVGVPTVGGEVSFDESYSGNPLVNAMALGLMETNEIVCSGAAGIGFPVVYVGSTTGRDGMGGASFASAELTNSSLDDRPAVQVGDPFLEKGLIEACLEAFKSGHVVAAQDMGAAGLTCSCSEMAAKGGVGIELNLDFVPAREEGMTPYEFMLSESQERMLFVVKPGKENYITELFIRWGLHVAVVGKVLEEKNVRVLYKGNIVADLPANALADDTPINKHELISEPPEYLQNHWLWSEDKLPKDSLNGISTSQEKHLTWKNILIQLLDYPIIASKKWIYSQYDYQVQSNTIIPPGGADAAVIRLRPQEGDKSMSNISKGVAAVVDCPNRWVALDPQRGAMAAVAEASRNLSCVGAKPLAVTDNLNFSSPDTSVGFWQLAQACSGLSKACKMLSTPVTGGNVSLYNETRKDDSIQPIQPTPVVGMVGLIDDLEKVIGCSWISEEDEIWIIGVDPKEGNTSLDSKVSLSASCYLESIHKLSTGRPPEINLKFELAVQNLLRALIDNGFINSAHDVSDGGIAVAIAECCILSNYGANILFNQNNIRLDRLLFAEGGSRVVISVKKNCVYNFLQFMKDYSVNNIDSVPINKIGLVTKKPEMNIYMQEHELIKIPVNEMKTVYENAIPRRILKRN